ncbi:MULTISPECIES: TetR/AcrR family transcriptional regulator [Catenuloplanes]|uniref:AcrR family transcriptional regulator n=1 Tax=Catenuloplanes niger TaxID=587534 RepID=A0AAE3ZU20_9ACTN|nr:TetR/AcrR family transcriptional regulator [Catenuloplanes niger]MDR7326073.1 AcrR family transcriptional regulator [Catenuloplanes niger]
MSIRERRERERVDRERLIIGVARELAEAEGWDAVTTRRLADRIEYSQPVLYSHFRGKGAIMAAVAVEGFAELAAELRAARTAAAGPRAALAATAEAYARFAETRPTLYEAMFTETAELTFGGPDAPAALRDAFGELREAVRAAGDDDDLDVRTEVLWAGLHGLVALTRGGRLPRDRHARRLALLIDRFAPH